MANDNKYLLGDSPVLESGREDLLSFRATAEVLADAAVETFDPLTIGIFGEWGSGKTSLMRLIKKEVAVRPNAVAVWFNAWQYEKEEHLIVPLVATINKELSDKEQTGWPENVIEVARKLGKALRSIAYGFSIKGKVGIPLVSEAEINLSGKEIIERYQDLAKDTLLFRSVYFDAFEELRECVEAGKVLRIVVFVDDLDRCFPDKAVALLEGIKLVLHQPGFSFVLGVNEKIIEAFIKTKYEKDFRIEGYYFDDYLDKIVQVKIPVPRREADDMKEFIVTLLKETAIFEHAIIDNAVPLIAEAGRHNPRSIVRLINRIMVTARIGKTEGKDFDPLLLLIHLATDEPRYKPFCEALSVNIVIESDGEKETGTIGQYFATAMERWTNHGELIDSLRKTKVLSREEELKIAVEIIAKNKNLYNLLNSEKGRLWLKDDVLRRTLSKASEISLGEKKSAAAVPHDLTDPVRELLANMVKIPAGEFNMGSDRHVSEKPIHRVKLHAFEIGAMPVTQAQYEEITGENPSHFKGLKNPVERVSWEDAIKFCKKLLERTGRRFSLPSEAQWEYACRAGSTAEYCFGDSENELGDYAWYDKNSDGETHPAGLKKPNQWGLYDTHGNVWEWVEDDWHDTYEGAAPDGGAWVQSPRDSLRVTRGGSWGSGPGYCRSAFRDAASPDYRGGNLGFRVLAVPAVEE